MTQNNLYMEDDEMRLYVDVQPLLLDEIENSRDAAAASATNAAQSETNARNLKNSIADYKTSMELFYAQASDGLTNLYNNSLSELTISKNSILNNIESAKRLAINNISTNGQNYVNQVQNIVDNRVSPEHLNTSKCLPGGDEMADSDAVVTIIDYAHSTFDESKFTVVGSPTITTDGIASGFKAWDSGNSYILVPITNLGSTFEIQAKIITSTLNAESYIFSIPPDSTLIFNIKNKKLNFNAGNGTNWISGDTTGTTELQDNSAYWVKFVYDGTKYASYLSTDGMNWNLEASFDSSTNILGSFSFICLGLNRYYSVPLNGSIDLKRFSITADGIPVFSGNKTGVDTIKADDYTAVGSPTITTDGILTSTTTNDNNYIKCEDFTASGNLRVEFSFKLSGGRLGTYLMKDNTDTTGLFLNQYGASFNYFGASNLGGTNYIQDGHSYDVYLEWKSDGTNELGIKKDTDNSYVTSTGTYSNLPTFFLFGYKYASNGVSIIDLNKIKFYSNGSLIYQPCLKIPYTESKTGSKVVDSVYYDRVKGAAEQNFIQRYYTLDEENGKVRLPIGDIYGMLEKLRQLIMERTAEE